MLVAVKMIKNNPTLNIIFGENKLLKQILSQKHVPQLLARHPYKNW